MQGEVEALDFHRSQFGALSADHDLVQPPGRQLSQEREARDDHVRLSGKAPVPDPPGYLVLGADHRDPVGHEHDSKQHRHDGHHDHTPTMGPAAGLRQASGIHRGTRPGSPGLAAAAAAGAVAAGRQTMNRCGGHGHLPARPAPVRAAQAAASAMSTASLKTTRPVTPRNRAQARASHLAGETFLPADSARLADALDARVTARRSSRSVAPPSGSSRHDRNPEICLDYVACGHLVQGGRCVRVADGEPHGAAIANG